MTSQDDDEEGAPLDPFADLLFTLIAAVLPAILVLLPAMHLSARAPEPAAEVPKPGSEPLRPARATVTVRGERAWPVVAQRGGLRLTGIEDRLVPLDAVPDDPTLRGALRGLRETGQPLLVIVEPDGLEAAFLLGPVAALHGPREMVQVRATETCAETRDAALAEACRAGAPAADGIRR